MPSPRVRSSLVLAVSAVALLALSGCASANAPEATTTAVTAPTATPSATEPAATPEPVDTVSAADVTCESLIGEELVAQLTDSGWTLEETDFAIGGTTLTDGIDCTWSDPEADPASETGTALHFGWAPIDAVQADPAVAALTADGFTREDSDNGFYLTEDPDFAINVDDEGYGETYEFGDGWVTVGDTKQDLILIQRPEL